MKPFTFFLSLLFSFILESSAFGQSPTGITYGGAVLDSLSEDTINMANAFLTGSAASTSNKDVIYFIHGLGGSPDAWLRADDATKDGAFEFPSRYTHTERPTYTEAGNLGSAGNDLATNLTNHSFNLNPANGFEPTHKQYIIAHSQGGLVSRDMIRSMQTQANTQDSLVGGLVTFGTPHLGAEILNNGLPHNMGGNGLIQNLAVDACRSLSRPYMLKYTDSLVSTKGFFLRAFHHTLHNAVDNINGLLCNQSANAVPLAFNNQTQNIVKSYFYKDSYLDGVNGLNSYIPSNISLVAFWGEENRPKFWRLINSLAEPVVHEPKFGANNDSTRKFDYVKMRADFAAEKHLALQHMHRVKDRSKNPCNWLAWAMSDLSAVLGLPFDCHDYAEMAENKVHAWDDALDFMDDANDKWARITGGQSDTTIRAGFNCVCQVNQNPDNVVSYPVPNATDCQPIKFVSNCYTTPRFSTVTNYKATDGVVTAESAKALPGKTVMHNNAEYTLKGSNHMQMRNDKNLKKKLKKLYNGDYGSFFQIPK